MGGRAPQRDLLRPVSCDTHEMCVVAGEPSIYREFTRQLATRRQPFFIMGVPDASHAGDDTDVIHVGARGGLGDQHITRLDNRRAWACGLRRCAANGPVAVHARPEWAVPQGGMHQCRGREDHVQTSSCGTASELGRPTGTGDHCTVTRKRRRGCSLAHTRNWLESSSHRRPLWRLDTIACSARSRSQSQGAPPFGRGPLLSLHDQLIDDARHAFGAPGDRRGSRLRRARRHRAGQRDRAIIGRDMDVAAFEQRLVEELRLHLGRNPS